MRLQNKVAIIAGRPNGIGPSTVQRFTEEGERVVIAEINYITKQTLHTDGGIV